MLLRLLVVLLAATVVLCAPNLLKGTPLLQKSQPSEKSKQVKISVRDVRTFAGRLPQAVIKSATASAKSFVTSSAVLIPVGLVLNLRQLKPIDAWLLKGVTTGVEWAKVGAYFVGAEVFFANIRKKDDRLNAYLGSGLTSGLLRMKEGPIGMVQGFAIGYGFMYALDQFVVKDPKKDAQSVTTSKLAASLRDLKSSLAPASVKSSSAIRRISAVIPVTAF